MGQLKPESELKLFLNELISGFGISIDDECLDDTSNPKALREKLSHASFNAFLNFIGSLTIIIKQMGTVLALNGYLDRLTFIFIQVLYLSKAFIKHLKLSIVETEMKVNEESSEDEEMKQEEQGDVKDALYRFVGHQSKVCMRKGLAIVK